MKIERLLVALFAIAMLCSCGGGENKEKKGTAFAPQEKESTMSDSERAQALKAKKASLEGIDIDSMLMMDGVKFSVLPPAVNTDLPYSAVEQLTTAVMRIAGENGVGALCTNPVLGLVTKVDCTERGMTSTAPQKAIAKYEVTFYCGNFITNDIYASTSTTVSGVGSNFDKAAKQAFSELRNTAKLHDMFATASNNAIKWYDNKNNIENVVAQAIANKNYALAMAFLSSVPSQATSTFEYASQRNQEVSELFFQSKADELLARMQAAIAASPVEYNPEVGACYMLIPTNSNAYKTATECFTEYCKNIESNRIDIINRARAVEDRDAQYAQQLEMERLQVEKIKAPFEAQATIAQIEADARVGVAQANADARVAVAQAQAEGKKNANTGGFLGLGKFWDGSFGLVNRIFDKLDGNDDDDD